LNFINPAVTEGKVVLADPLDWDRASVLLGTVTDGQFPAVFLNVQFVLLAIKHVLVVDKPPCVGFTRVTSHTNLEFATTYDICTLAVYLDSFTHKG
jgi:hypothetical protein